MPHVFTKQIAETFKIWAGITNVISVGESIAIANCTITAYDVDGTDVTSTILDLATKAVYDTTKVEVQVKAAGVVASSPYKITFIIVTDVPNTWEVDVQLKIRDD